MHRSRLRPHAFSDGAGASVCSPIPYAVLKFTQFHGYGGRPFAGNPSPEHQRCRHVLDDLLDAAMPVLHRVLKQFAKLRVS